jgi:hypothetical protein
VDFKRGDLVCKTGGDYTFYGRVVATFHKWNKADAVRVVVEDDRGLLLIMNPKQIRESANGEWRMLPLKEDAHSDSG